MKTSYLQTIEGELGSHKVYGNLSKKQVAAILAGSVIIAVAENIISYNLYYHNLMSP